MEEARRLPAVRDDWALFLDVDGTLLEIAPTPDGVSVDAALPRMLERLRERFGGALALISGRSLSALDLLFHPFRLPAAGIHGIERRDAAGELHFEGMEPKDLDPARDLISQFLAAHPMVRVEDKGRSLAVHYRLAPELELAAQQVMERALARLPPEAHVQGGSGVLELKSRASNKRIAIQAFMQEAPFHGRIPVFAGDDLTDRDGFAYVDSVGGVPVRVAGEPSGKDPWLPDPAAVRAWLRSLLP